MKLLVTGGAGYIGSSLTTRFIERGHEVIVWDRLDHGGEGLLHLVGHPRFKIVIGDVREPPPGFVKTVDEVVHLAAIVGEPACIEAGKDETFAVNVDSARAIADRFGDRPCVMFSTASNYGRSEGLVREDADLNPIGSYAESKIVAEEQFRDANLTILRLATICGPSPRPRFDLLVNDIARRAELDMGIQIYGSRSHRPFLHIHDAAEAALLGLSIMEPGTFNVVGENIQKGDLAVLARVIFPEATVDLTNMTGEDPRDYRVDGSLFEDHTGFEPQKGIREALREVRQQIRLLPDSERRAYRNVEVMGGGPKVTLQMARSITSEAV